MKWISHSAYLVVGITSLLLAVFVASKFVRPARSQTEPNVLQKIRDFRSEEAPTTTTKISEESVTPSMTEGTSLEQKGAVPITESVPFLEPYVYDVREGRRNPFRPPVQADGTLADMVMPGTPLERYELDELKVAAIMWDVKAPKAMIVDPQGEIHILGKDDRIGRRRGYIATIREGEVVVVETTNFNGENAFSTRILRIDN